VWLFVLLHPHRKAFQSDAKQVQIPEFHDLEPEDRHGYIHKPEVQ
jgi:hypothetical protein